MKSFNNSNYHNNNNRNQSRVIDTDGDNVDNDDDDYDRKPAARILDYDSNTTGSNDNNTSRTDAFSNNTATTHTSASTDDNEEDDDSNNNNNETDYFNETLITSSVAASASATAVGRRKNDKTPMKSNSTTSTKRTSPNARPDGGYNQYIELKNDKKNDTMSYYSPSLATITTVGSSTSTLMTTATSAMISPSSMTIKTKSDTTKNNSNNNSNSIIDLSSSIQQLMIMLNIPSMQSILTSVLPVRIVNIIQNTDRGVIVWTITSTISFGILVHELIPRNVMIAILAVCMSLGMLLQRIQVVVQQWYNTTIINGNGIGETLLSSRMYNMLLEQSLHDFMTTNIQQGSETSRHEYRHLLLYLLPLSIEQRSALVQRLTPTHQNALHRPGIVHWLPSGLIHDNCMKLLIGTNRFNNLYNNTNNTSNTNARNQQRLSARVARQQQQQNIAVSQQLVSPGSSVSILAGQSLQMVTTPLSIESNNNNNNNTIIAPTTTTATGSTSRIGQLLLNADDESVASDLGLDVSDNDVHDQQVLSLAQRFGFISVPSTTTTSASPAAPVHVNVNVNHSTPIQAQPPFTPGIGDGTALVPLDTNNTIDDEDDDIDTITSEEAVEEGNVLLDAMLYAFNNVIVHPANRVSNVYVLPYMTNQILRWSTRIFTMSASIGTIGYIGGFYPTIVLPTLSTVVAAATATVTATTLSLVGSTTTSNFRSSPTSSNINISSIYPSAQSIVTLMAISGSTSFGFAIFYKYLQYKNDQRSLSLLSKDDEKK